MKKSVFMIITILVFLSFSSTLMADVPMLLNYQGYVEANGVPVNGNGYFKFAIVNQTGDTSYWSNDGTSTSGDEPDNALVSPVSKGVFTVKLGDTDLTNMTVLPTSPFNEQDIYVRVWFSVNNETFEQLAPDTQIVSTGFAYKAQSVVESTPSKAGVAWLDGTDPVEIAAENLTSVSNITVNAPSSGFVIVTSSGFVNWLVQSDGLGLINFGLSQTANNLDPPTLEIGINGITAVEYYRYPFSLTRVFPVNSGNNLFYLNCKYNDISRVEGRAWVHNHTLVGLFVPNRY